MRCTRAQRRFEAYLGDEMSERERTRLERHLAACVECGRALKSASQLRAVLGETRTPAVPGGFHARLIAQARERAEGPAAGGGVLRRLAWVSAMPGPFRAAAAVAVVVSLAVGAVIGRDMWRMENRQPAEQARLAAADPTVIYRIDYLGEAPGDSLAGAYVSLLSGGRGK